MAASWSACIVGIVAFFVVLVIGINLTGTLDAGTDLSDAGNKVVAILGRAHRRLIGYAVTEYAQTGRLDRSRRSSTRGRSC